MGLLRELSIALVFVILISSNVSGDQVSLTGEGFITYEPRPAKNPRRTEITLRFRTIHSNGLLVYSTRLETQLDDAVRLLLFLTRRSTIVSRAVARCAATSVDHLQCAVVLRIACVTYKYIS